MNILLVRHARTIENNLGIMTSLSPGRISKEGKLQLKDLSFKLKNKKIDAIFSSDLFRAVITAKAVLKNHSLIPHKLLSELREIDVGSYTGKSKKLIDWSKDHKNFESMYSFKKRVVVALNLIYSKYSDGTVLIVSHNGTMKMIKSILLNKNYKEYYKNKKFVNCKIYNFKMNSKVK